MVDIRIMAHPSRKENVYKILKILDLSDSIITWDDRPGINDAMYTARKAWTLPIPYGCTHRLVLQDDIEVCDNFINIVNEVAKSNPNQIVSFAHLDALDCVSRYHECLFDMGVALMVPVKLLDDFWWFVDNRLPVIAKPSFNTIIKIDTTCMRYWVRYRNIPCVTTVPSLVQHIGDDSLVGIDRKRISKDYTKTPPITGW